MVSHLALSFKGRVSRPAFTMIEIIFVIVVLGILAAVAVPRLAATRDDAELVKGRNDIAAIRSSIVTKRSQDILSGNGAVYPDLNKTAPTSNTLFDNVLDYPIYEKSGNGHWQRKVNNTSFTFTINNTPVTFTYNKTQGIFDCNHNANNEKERKLCQQLAE